MGIGQRNSFSSFFLRFHSFLSDFLKSSKSWFSISWIGLKFKPLKFVMDLKTLKLQTFGKFSKWLPWRNQLCKSPDPGNNCSWNMKTRNTVTEAIWWFLGIWAANLSQLIRHQVQVQVQEQTFTNYQFEAKLKVFCPMFASKYKYKYKSRLVPIISLKPSWKSFVRWLHCLLPSLLHVSAWYGFEDE